ncbi:Blue-light-activated protein (plasmid) [Variovorax sp. SRS16]|uniref:PAS domain-containing sensor histidine kinase n=1 Tax=Variovorax sp. SRS16 TaxID=282217 RepID=UPI001316AFA9|nr:Blue-light-activated protein [Variovorax sp. SRS16]
MDSGDRLDDKRLIELKRFELLVSAIHDYAIYMLDARGHVVSWNAGAERFKGYAASEIIGEHFSRFYSPEDRAAGIPDRALKIAETEGTFQAEGWRVRKDGKRFWASVVIDPIFSTDRRLLGFAKITRDITERREAAEVLKRTERALLQAQKMETIGKLTGGVAHDFNNLLQVIAGNLQLLARDVAGIEQAERRIENALAGVRRGAKLAGQLLAFGRRQTLEPKVVNLGHMVQAMAEMLQRALGEGVLVETTVDDDLWNTFADVSQVENALLNLAINARDAMEGAGKLTVEIGNATLDADYAREHDEVDAGDYVMLAVSDTGSGMPPEVVAQAFDPFYTTKPEGKGTGLGLSMVYGFVKQSGGHVKIYSELGYGTTVKVYLPRSFGAEQAIALSDVRSVVGGTETILVAEDDEHVRATAVETLQQLGYQVLAASDAEGALAIVKSGVKIDLLFTDVVMPGLLRSPDMARQACDFLPGLAVLYTSGYTRNAIVHGGRLDPGLELLPKPYSREDLTRRIRGALDHQSERDSPEADQTSG